MARVGITKDLIQTTKSKIDRFEIQELNMLKDPFDSFNPSAGDQFIQDFFWEGRMDLKQNIPESWLYNQKQEVAFNVIPQSDASWYSSDKRVDMDFSTHPIPHHTGRKNRSIINIPPEAAKQYGLDLVPKYREDCKAIEERYKKVKKDVTSFLESCKSLNEAVKLWPDIRTYIDKHYLERLDKVAEKSEPKKTNAMEVLSQIDIDAVQATAVAARLSTS